MPDVGTFASCGFCHTLVDVDIDTCPQCGHQPHVSRMDCRCGRAGCRDTAGHPVAYVPPSVEVQLEAVRLIDFENTESIGEHEFSPDPRAPSNCIHCGCSLELAAAKPCGPR